MGAGCDAKTLVGAPKRADRWLFDAVLVPTDFTSPLAFRPIVEFRNGFDHGTAFMHGSDSFDEVYDGEADFSVVASDGKMYRVNRDVLRSAR